MSSLIKLPVFQLLTEAGSGDLASLTSYFASEIPCLCLLSAGIVLATIYVRAGVPNYILTLCPLSHFPGLSGQALRLSMI